MSHPAWILLYISVLFIFMQIRSEYVRVSHIMFPIELKNNKF